MTTNPRIHFTQFSYLQCLTEPEDFTSAIGSKMYKDRGPDGDDESCVSQEPSLLTASGHCTRDICRQLPHSPLAVFASTIAGHFAGTIPGHLRSPPSENKYHHRIYWHRHWVSGCFTHKHKAALLWHHLSYNELLWIKCPIFFQINTIYPWTFIF